WSVGPTCGTGRARGRTCATPVRPRSSPPGVRRCEVPLYEYRCPCGVVTERLRSVKDRDVPILCPSCGHDYAFRVASRPAYPGFVDKRRVKDRGLTPIFHNRGGPR